MSDGSKFILRWEIDNATAVHRAGKAESKVFNEGGFEWKIKMDRKGIAAKFALECSLNQPRHWKCEGTLDVRLLRKNDKAFASRDDVKFLFNDNNILCRLQLQDDMAWDGLTSKFFNVNDKVTWEFHVHIIKLESGRPIGCKFAAPNNKSNVILKIGDKKLHVFKEYLAVQSPVFDALFFGDFVEKGKEEVEMKDAIYEEFIDLLDVIYLETEITDRTVPHILKLADQFQIENVLNMSKKYLVNSKGIETVQKLIIVEKYRFDDLRVHCLNSVSNVAELNEMLKSSPEVPKFSDEMKAAIFNRYLQLIQ